MFKKLFFLVLFLLIATPVQAVSWPPEVKPEQGKASGTFTKAACTITYTFTFWNVGETGVGDYGNTTFTAETTCSGSSKPDLETLQGVFSGGPNGKVTIEGFVFNLVNGTYFVTTDAKGETHQFPLENPEIFSKYNWDDNTTSKENQAQKSKLEDSGVAFSDLYGQVEVNIPNEDGTYDEENWSFAKLDGKTFPVGTHIKTSEKSGGYISFADMTTFTLKPESEIILSSPAAKNSQVKLLAGNLWINVKKMFKDGSMEIEMSQAVAGIKGTRFILNETKTESSIWVTEGTVKFTSKSTGKSVDVSKGESVVVSAKGLSEKTTFNPVEEENKWQELSDNFRKTSSNVAGFNNNYMYIVGGVVFVAAIFGFLIFKIRKSKTA